MRHSWRELVSWALFGLLLGLGISCQPRSASSETKGPDASGTESRDTSVQELGVQVLRRLPHDDTAFTQGLLWYQGKLFESTGLYGESTLRRLDPVTGVVEKRIALPDSLFGEGLARIGDRLIQLTWKEGVVRRYRLNDFSLVDERHYQGEGWGLCYDGRALVMSDGSDVLAWRDPESFAIQRSVPVRLRGVPVRQLNELECAEGWIYANQLNSDWIYRIDPTSGNVVARIDASGLDPADENIPERVLNGIAYDDASHHFYITGKKWSLMLEAIFVER